MKIPGSHAMQITMALLVVWVITAGVTAAGQKNKKESEPPPVAERPTNGSLFTDSGRNVDLFRDLKPYRIGDIVFVDVVETSTASVSSSAKASSESGTLGAAVIGAAPLPTQIAGGAAAVLGALGSRKYDGKGSTERSSKLRARIAARVVEVLPNGDLQIEAEKRVKINKEEELLTLSGLVRPRDVMPDNAVLSTSVADLRVHLNGKGVASAHNGPGWLARFLEKISPF